MDLLVLGGTQFIGRAIARAAHAAGHAVAVFNRGQSPDDLPDTVLRLRGDRDAGAHGLAALRGRHWQACIDASGYTPGQVGASVRALGGRVERYVYISAVSVYGAPTQGPVDEEHPRVAPAAAGTTAVDGSSYGPLKVACEDLVTQAFAAAATLLRPQVVVGPGDPWNRYSHWVQRARQPGPMLAPGDGSDPLQVIDVRDLARFALAVVEAAAPLGGAYNLAGPALDWARFIALIGAAQPVWVPAAQLQAAGLDFMTLPLWRARGSPRAGLMAVDSRRAQAAGLRLTDPARTVADVAADGRGRRFTPALPPAVEAALLAGAAPAA